MISRGRGRAILLCAGLLICGCGASTEYVPARKGRAYLVLKDGLPAYYKDGKTALIYTDDDAKELLACDAVATGYVSQAQSQMGTAQGLFLIGSMFGLVGALITGPIAASHQDRAGAASIDALNSHNEAPQCVQPPPVAQASSRGHQ